ncbi:MAG: transcriptional regulator NrdR [Fimbriimonas sp.]
MRCPFCGYDDLKVLDSRPVPDGETIRRRRECLSCARRFTTVERAERPRLFVVKRDGGREEFNREKAFESMRIACRKRPVSIETLREAVGRIERDLFQEVEDEVTTKEVGGRVMRELSTIDTVAYVRFASVYQEFETVADFAAMVEKVQQEEALAPFRLQESLL